MAYKHKASSIKENPNKRFSNDSEIAKWNNTKVKLDEIKSLKDNGYVSTVDTDYLTIDNCIEGYSKNTVIGGNTLVNISKTFKSFVLSSNPNNPNTHVRVTKPLSDFVYKASTTYTVFVTITKNTITGYNTIKPLDNYGTVFPQSGINIARGQIGTFSCLIKTNSELNGNGWQSLMYQPNGDPISGEVIVDNIMIIEGDHTNKSYEYFKGIQGVGDLTSDNRYSINTVMSSMNLLNHSSNLKDYDVYDEGANISLKSNGEIHCNHVGGNAHYIIRKQLIKLYPNTKYYLSNEILSELHGRLGVRLYDINDNIITSSITGESSGYNTHYKAHFFDMSDSNKKPKRYFITPSNAVYCQIGYLASGNSYIIKDVMLEKSNTPSAVYWPYRRIINSIYLNQQLNKLPNGVKDTIEYIDNKLYLVKRVGKVILDGSEEWFYENSANNTSVASFYTYNHKAKSNSSALCDKFKWIESVMSNVEGFRYYTKGTINIAINRSKLNSIDSNGMSTFLQENNTVVLYELEQTEYIELPNYDINYKLYKDRTHIWFDNNISPTIKLDYPISISGSVSSSLTQISEIKEELKDIEKLEEEYKFNYTANPDGSITCIETNNSYVDDISIKGNSIKNLDDGIVEGFYISSANDTDIGYESPKTSSKIIVCKPNTKYYVKRLDLKGNRFKVGELATYPTTSTKVIKKHGSSLTTNVSNNIEYQELSFVTGSTTNYLLVALDYSDVLLTEEQAKLYVLEDTNHIPEYFNGLQSTNPIIKTTSINNSNLVDYSNIDLPIEYGLKKLPNGVYDEIIKNGDSYKLIQRVGYYNMKDFTGFLSQESPVDNMRRWYFKPTLAHKTNSVFCNCTILDSANSRKSDPDFNGKIAYGYGTIECASALNGFGFYLNQDRGTTNTQALDWLKDNNARIEYELETPIEYDLGNISPKTFIGDTLIEIDSNIPPSEFKFSITSSINNTIKVLLDKIAVLERKVFEESRSSLSNVLVEVDNKFKLKQIIKRLNK